MLSRLQGVWYVGTLDSSGDVGKFSSIAIDRYDSPHISYCDVTNGYLKYAYFPGGLLQIWILNIIVQQRLRKLFHLPCAGQAMAIHT